MPTGRVNSPEMYATAEYIAAAIKKNATGSPSERRSTFPGRTDERSVANYRADCISVGNLAVSADSACGGDHDLGQCCSYRNDGSADEQLGQVKSVRNGNRAVYEPIAALDEHNETENKKKNRNKHITVTFALT